VLFELDTLRESVWQPAVGGSVKYKRVELGARDEAHHEQLVVHCLRNDLILRGVNRYRVQEQFFKSRMTANRFQEGNKHFIKRHTDLSQLQTLESLVRLNVRND